MVSPTREERMERRIKSTINQLDMFFDIHKRLFKRELRRVNRFKHLDKIDNLNALYVSCEMMSESLRSLIDNRTTKKNFEYVVKEER